MDVQLAQAQQAVKFVPHLYCLKMDHVSLDVILDILLQVKLVLHAHKDVLFVKKLIHAKSVTPVSTCILELVMLIVELETAVLLMVAMELLPAQMTPLVLPVMLLVKLVFNTHQNA
jgi:hypothetical protein